MNKILEYTIVTFMVIGIFSLIFAVGAIDGGYNGVPMNDNWLGFIIFTSSKSFIKKFKIIMSYL